MTTKESQNRKPSRGEKRHTAMMEAAWKLFLEKGYAGVSLDDIIRVSGGSKATFYKQFGNKEGILAAVVDRLATQILEEIELTPLDGSTPKETLRRFGLHLCELALSDMAIRQHRLAVSCAIDFPKVAKRWFETGPNRVMEGLASYLGREAAAGRLKIKDPTQAAHLFGGMLVFYHNMRRLIGLRAPPQAEIKAIVNEAVDLFLQRYQV